MGLKNITLTLKLTMLQEKSVIVILIAIVVTMQKMERGIYKMILSSEHMGEIAYNFNMEFGKVRVSIMEKMSSRTKKLKLRSRIHNTTLLKFYHTHTSCLQ